MTIERLRKHLLAAPFQPFTVQMADGREYVVPHREFMSHSPSGRTAIVFLDGTEDDSAELDLLLMTGIKIERETGKRSNGESKKPKH
jgi:hypothetical protein